MKPLYKNAVAGYLGIGWSNDEVTDFSQTAQSIKAKAKTCIFGRCGNYSLEMALNQNGGIKSVHIRAQEHSGLPDADETCKLNPAPVAAAPEQADEIKTSVQGKIVEENH